MHKKATSQNNIKESLTVSSSGQLKISLNVFIELGLEMFDQWSGHTVGKCDTDGFNLC